MLNANNGKELQEVIKNIRSGSMQLGREGSYRSDADTEKLKSLFFAGLGITAIALDLQRTDSAVYQQIEKLNLFRRGAYSKQPMSPDASGGKCRCRECTCDSIACPIFNKSCFVGIDQST